MSDSRQRKRVHVTSRPVLVLLMLAVLLIGSSTLAQESTPNSETSDSDVTVTATELTVTPTDTPTESQTDTPTAAPTDELTATPTDAPTREATETTTATASDTPTEAPTETDAAPTGVTTSTENAEPGESAENTATPTETGTEQVTEEPAYPPDLFSNSLVSPLAMQSLCQIESYGIVGSDPLHYEFTAFDSSYTSYSWDFDDGGTGDGLTTDHAFASAGNYHVTLTCSGDDPSASTSTDIAVSDEMIVVAFTVAATPDNSATEPTVVVHTTNTGTTGADITYSWTISRAGTPIFTTTDPDFDHPLTWADLGSSGSATLDFALTVYGPNSFMQTVTRSLVVNLPPKVDFAVTPTIQELTAGSAAFTITLSQDPHSGPLTSASWTLDADADVTPDLPTGDPFTGTYTVTYNDAGAHEIALTYSGPGGGGYIQRSVLATTASEDIAASFTYRFSTANGVISVCYTNTSSGPVVSNHWEFGDGDMLDSNDLVVCHAYDETSGTMNAVLTVFNADSEQAQTQEAVNLGNAIVANFTTNPDQAAGFFSGSAIQFTDTSTHGPQTWSWDFGDGSTSSQQNPSHTYSQAGQYLVRLTVTNETGTAYVEKTFDVEVGSMTCGAIDGPGFVTPVGASASGDYDVAVTGANGRTLTYTWVITPVSGWTANPLTTTTTDTSNTLHATFTATATFQIAVNVQTDDGASCNSTRSITRGWAGLECDIALPGDLPSPLYANGSTYTFTATDSTPVDRSVLREWTVTENSQSGSGQSFNWQNTGTTSGSAQTFHVVYTVTPDDDPSHPCVDTKTITVAPWPSLVCNISGQLSPIPETGVAGEDGVYTYSVNTNGSLTGRTPVYTWNVGPNGSIQSGQGTDTITVKWTAPSGFTGSTPSTISVSMAVDNPDGAATDSPCANAQDVNITVGDLTCDAITGNLNPQEKNFSPLVSQTVTYSSDLSGVHGRTLDFWWAITDALGTTYAVGPLAHTSSTTTLPLTFPVQGEAYTIVYHASVAADTAHNLPADDCTSADATINVRSTGQYFYCEAALSGNQMPSSSGNYPYKFTVDNGNGALLQYVYTLTDRSDTSNAPIVLYTTPAPGSTATGEISHNFSLDELGSYGAGNYRLNVRVTSVDPDYATDYACDWNLDLTVGQLTVDYSTAITQTPGHTWNRAHVPVGQEICLTNTSAVVPASTPEISYTWTINGPSSLGPAGKTVTDDGNPLCFSFTEAITPGNPYSVTLDGINNERGLANSQSYDFSVYQMQSISIADPGTLFANVPANFEITGEHIDTYSWSLYQLSGPGGSEVGGALATGTGQSPTHTFTGSGWYRLKAVGHGPLEDTKAQMDFEVLAAGALSVRFLAMPTAGVGPLTICFTDQSATAPPTTLTTWDWDFGDGSAHDSVQNPCHTYSGAAGTQYTVRLTVTNSVNTTLSATKIIRLYTLTEANLDFRFVYHAGGEVCFMPDLSNVPAGFSVTSWDFGDGDIVSATGNGEICHTYTAVGTTYTVVMHVEDEGGAEYTHEHNVTPQGSTSPVPELSIAGECGTDRIARFTITNTGGAFSDNVTMRNEISSDVLISGQPIEMDAGTEDEPEILTIIAPSVQSGTVSLTLANTPYPDGTIAETDNPCNYPSDISVTVTCIGNLPSFTVTNASADGNNPMVGDQDFEIRDSQDNLIVSDSFNLGSGPASQEITLGGGTHNPYETYTFRLTGTQVVDLITYVGGTGDSLPSNCATPPQVSFAHDCAALTFTISNDDGGGDMVLVQDYTVTGNGKIYHGTFQLDAGDSTTIDLTTLDDLEPFDPYAGYTLALDGADGFITVADESMDCARPVVSVTHDCAALSFTFEADDAAGDMLLPQTFTISGNGKTYTGTFQLAAGATETIDLTTLIDLTPFDPYAGYTLTSSGEDAFVNITSDTMDCAQPHLSVAWQCGAVVSFTVSNDGVDAGDMLVSQNYIVTDADGNPVLYTVTDQDSNSVPPGSMMLGIGKSITISLLDANPYQSYKLTTTGFAGTFDVTHHCDAPSLKVTSRCDSPGSFKITNTGGDMLTAHTYQLTARNGVDITPVDHTFMLLHDWKTTITVPDGYVDGVRFTTSDLGISARSTIDCDRDDDDDDDSSEPVAAPIVTETPTPAPVPVAAALPTRSSGGYYYGGSSGNFGGLPSTTLQQPDWTKAVCGHSCPTFKVYHTDEPGNWNIYRLNSADEQTRQYDHHNLTFGEGRNASGDDITDMSPGLSPSNEWVAFTSNRDDNWEIYVASTSGDPNSVRRVTFNTLARDVNPVWGPNNFLVFQSTRNGNWDLYAIDMATGQEYQLTSDPADDINPYWSPDGSRLLFQSDRPDENGVRKWQIYVLDLVSGLTERLSDGTSIDVDPQYSNDGMQIVYRTYAQEGDNSVITLMDRDGRNRRAITQPTEDATNPSWSPQDHYIAYQSNQDGDLDVYVYELATNTTRKLTDNSIPDYAPTWECDETRVVFTSDVEDNPNIYDADVQPISDGPILVQDDARQWTFDSFDDVYPLGSDLKEVASREGQTPTGAFGQQTEFLKPDAAITDFDRSDDGAQRKDWNDVGGC